MTIFIYGLECPVEKVIRYVGKSIEPEKRLQGHIAGAKSGAYNHHTARWIRTLLASGLRPTLQIIVEVPEGTRWQDVERDLIASAGEKGWRLTNSTAGGEGLDYLDPEDTARYRSNLSRSLKVLWSTPERREEARLRAVAVHANPEIVARRKASLRAAFSTPESKAKLSAASKAVHARPEVKAKRSARTKECWQDPEYRAKLFDEPTRNKMSEKAKARWKDDPEKMAKSMNLPERKAKLSAAMKRRNATPEYRAKMDNPEMRARQAVTLKATWAKRKADPEFVVKVNGPEARAKQGVAMKANWAMRKAAKAAAQQE